MMKRIHHLPILLLLLLLPSLSLQDDFQLSSPLNGISLKQAPKLSPIDAAKTDTPTFRFSRLRRLKGPLRHRSALSVLTSRLHRVGPSSQNSSSVGNFSTEYAIDCLWDGTPASLIFDTGSADSWVVKGSFQCEDETGDASSQASCAFGKPHIDDFAHGPVDDVHFFLKYGDGEVVSGPMGYSDITCGGLSVEKQQVGLANHTIWHGNNVTVGILGLAYASLTSAFFGSIGDEAEWNAATYPPFLTTAISQGSIDPMFSVAIMKNSSDGAVAWGGLPPIPYDKHKNASTDLLIANLAHRDETAWKYSFFTIIPDGLKWGTRGDVGRYPYIVDTGSTLMLLPPPLVEDIALAFDPQAVYLYQWDAYFADCNATPPQLSVVISGVEFRIKPDHLIYRDMIDPLTGYCAIGIASGKAGPYVLGDVFLQNVLAVFDVGAAQMRFYGRK